MTQKADYILDLRGEITPLALLKVTHLFREMKADEILEILGRDIEAREDIFKLLASVSYETTAIEEMEDSCYLIRLKKR